jgi:hypothetical protein
LVGVAVNVTDWPEHVVVLPDVTTIETAGVTVAVTATVTVLDVAVVGLAHDELEVIIQLML